MEFKTVEKSTIPETSERTAKYQEILDSAKKLKPEEAIEVNEQKDVSLTSIMSFMRKKGYKITQRTVQGKKSLYITKKTD